MVWDQDSATTSTFNSWGLKLRAATPVAAPKKGAGVFSQTKPVNALVPDDVAAGPSTPLSSTITVPKKFKGLRVGDLDITGFTATGNGGTDPANDLRWKLTAPNEGTLSMGENGLGTTSIGPLTMDDDSKVSLCDRAHPCPDPLQTLGRPFAGTGNTQQFGTGGTGNLDSFNRVPMAGLWTLLVWDEVTAGESNTFNSWGLKITAEKPVKN